MAETWFSIPPERIAREPLSQRDGARLLHWQADGTLADRHIPSLVDLLHAGDILVVNDVRVVPARVPVERPGGGLGELLFIQPWQGADDLWMAWGRPAKRLVGRFLRSPIGDLRVDTQRTATGGLLVRLASGAPPSLALERAGELPLPPYLQRPEQPQDRARYQTVYASKSGAVAAPTAGLHLSQSVLNELKAKGVASAHLTLHVGPGTFQPIRSERVEDHELMPEYCVVPGETAEAIARCQAGGGRVAAVGTTVVRSLEKSAQVGGGEVVAWEGFNPLYLYPGGPPFQVVDTLLTNFHLPDSSLIQLVAAFAGVERTKQAYDHAIAGDYRFYSYGDANWIERLP